MCSLSSPSPPTPLQEEARRRERSSYAEDQTLEWRGGLAQKRAVEERKKTMAEEVIIHSVYYLFEVSLFHPVQDRLHAVGVWVKIWMVACVNSGCICYCFTRAC